MKKSCPDNEFIELFETHGANETARRLGLNPRNVYYRRARIEKKIGRQLVSPNQGPVLYRHGITHPQWVEHGVKNGVVIVGSDAHYWPGIETTAHRGFVRFIKELKPSLVVLNGDIIDGATVSRFQPIGWETRPTLIQEIEACQGRLGEIERAAGKARKIWTLGNHDGRFETRLATVAPEYAKIHGVHLQDHFPLWEPAWAVIVNGNTVIKHRFKGGLHAPHNNTLWAGKSILTGHLHSMKVQPISDYNGTRWGVDTGTLAEPYGPQFRDYTEQNPLSWRSGFVVLTYENGDLRWPELAHAYADGKIDFRGRTVNV